MNSHQIHSCIKQDPITQSSFHGVFPQDMLFKQKIHVHKNNSYICNTAPSTNSGEHWFALYIDSELNGEYFDSYGLDPDETFASFLDQHCFSWTRNIIPLQKPFSTVCGQHCIFWIHSKGLGYNSECIIETLKKKMLIKLF